MPAQVSAGDFAAVSAQVLFLALPRGEGAEAVQGSGVGVQFRLEKISEITEANLGFGPAGRLVWDGSANPYGEVVGF